MKLLLENHECVENNEVILFWKGCCIYKDEEVGFASVKKLLSDFIVGGINFNSLFGFFIIILQNKKTNSLCFFCDNSSFIPLYFSKKKSIISDSLIKLTGEAEEISFNIYEVFTFLEFGFFMNGNTFFDNIYKCLGNKIYTFENNILKITEKNIVHLKKFEKNYFLKNITKIFQSFNKEKILIDATGGTDSRLLIAIAKALNLDFELFVRGQIKCADIDIANQIAKIVDKKIHYFKATAVSVFSFSYLQKLFKSLDGVIPLFEGYQLLCANIEKKKLGFKYSISGVAGEYYKQFWFLRVFRKNKFFSNSIFTYFRTKINVLYISENFKKQYFLYNSKLISKFKIEDKTKIKTYINWMSNQFFPQKSGLLCGVFTNYCCVYAPMAEKLLSNYAYYLTVNDKIFQKNFRKILNSLNKELALLPTIYGYTLSLSCFNLLKDFFSIFSTLCKRIYFKYIKRKTYKPKTFAVSAQEDKYFFDKIDFVKDIESTLINSGIFSEELSLKNMSVVEIERVLCIFFWLKTIEEKI